MFETFRNAWKIPDLRKKLLYTLFVIIIFRVGSAIPVPYLNPSVMSDMIAADSGSMLGYLNVLTGGSFANATLFAMSILPYINASIIMQLLTVAIPPLERLAKEGEVGRKKINRITKYVALGIGLVQAFAYYLTLRNSGAVDYTTGFSGIYAAIVIILTFTAGTSLIVWLGEQVNEKGIGNGISIILFAGIISRGPGAVISLLMLIGTDTKYVFLIPIILIIFIMMIAFIITMTNAERRIPVQYAKRVVGRKMYGGQSTHIPIKVVMSGVMPIIFAMSIMSIPGTIGAFLPNPETKNLWYWVLWLFKYTNPFYAVLYFLLIIGFNYFYVAIQYNPVEIANNLRKNNGAIPGIRPGRPTSDFISRVLSKITLIGAIFLGIIAVFPIMFGAISGVNIAIGGTSILIIVNVALETVRTLESQMMMRHHKGFLE